MLGPREAQVLDVQAANGSPTANEALDRIGALYGIEAGIRGKSPDSRQPSREEKPLIDSTGHRRVTTGYHRS